MRFASLCVAVLLALSAASQALAQGATPGKEHEWLKESVGEWEFKMDVGGQEMVGSAVYKMGLGGLWLVSDVEMDMGGAKFTGHGLDSYDPAKKKYVSVWIDSQSSTPLMLEGDLSDDKKILTMTGKGPASASGEITDYKTVSEYKDKDTHIFKMWVGNLTGEPMMTATYKRKK